jgi:hypothetical protein
MTKLRLRPDQRQEIAMQVATLIEKDMTLRDLQ